MCVRTAVVCTVLKRAVGCVSATDPFIAIVVLNSFSSYSG